MAIDQKMQKEIQQFVTDLTGTPERDVKKYIAEILTDTKFQNDIEYKTSAGEERPFSVKILGIDTTACVALYALCRAAKPQIMVETGVAAGISSSYILQAMAKNNCGKLYSIDVPWYTVKENWKPFLPDGQLVDVPIEKDSGWMIPDYLRNRWELILGKSTEMLPPLLKKLGDIDIFFHDSQHTYETMLWEFQNAWPGIKPEGILFVHNSDITEALPCFSQSVNSKMVLLNGVHNEIDRLIVTGAIRKE